MPKSQSIEPEVARAKGFLELAPIPVNRYDAGLMDELSSGAINGEDAMRIQRDMLLIRTFELMLESVKKQGHYQGVPYQHRGPAHLSIGQEAAAVGQAFLLDVEDHFFGSHRSHGEILAKGLSAIAKTDDDELMKTMENYFDGACLKVVEKDAQGNVQDLAIDFLVYGALAEIFGRDTGFNRGFGGSMHAFFPPWGIFPNNAIVGGNFEEGKHAPTRVTVQGLVSFEFHL